MRRALGVGYVVEGSVRKAGKRVRVTAQLIDAASGGHLWAERYDRDLEDIFAVQDDVTHEIVGALAVKLTQGEARALANPGTHNVDCYDLLLRGREQFYQFTAKGNATALGLFEQAAASDPRCAEAEARIAQVYLAEHRFAWNMPADKALSFVDVHVGKALAIDSNLRLAFSVLGYLRSFEKRYGDALVAFERWHALAPNDADSLIGVSSGLTSLGRGGEALPYLERSMRLNPNYGHLTLYSLGRTYFQLERFEDAAKALQRSLVRSPTFVPSALYRAAALVRLGQPEEARKLWAETRAREGRDLGLFVANLDEYANPADSARVTQPLREAGLIP